MPWICTPDFSGGCAEGVRSGPWCLDDMVGQPVPLTIKRRRLDPGATDRIPLRGRENFAYVIAGSGTAAASPDLVSTRDTRDRLDLVTDDVPVGARAVRADRCTWAPVP